MEAGDGVGDCVRQQRVVGVEEADDVSAGHLSTGIERGRLAAVALEDGYDTVPVAGDDLGGPVTRPVVDDDHLDARVGLRERAVDRARQEACVVVVRDDDRDERRHCAFPSRTGRTSRSSLALSVSREYGSTAAAARSRYAARSAALRPSAAA